MITDFGSEKFISITTNSSSGLLEGVETIEKKYPHIAIYRCIQEVLSNLCEQLLHSEEFQPIWEKLENLKIYLKTLSEEKLPYALQNYIWIFKKYDRFLFDYMVRIKSVVKDFFTQEWTSWNDIFGNEEEFWKSIEEIDKLLQPILSTLSKYKESAPPLNHVVPLFDSLRSHFESCLSQTHQWNTNQQVNLMKFLEESKNSTLHPIHFAANFFDPLAKGANLSLTQQMQATEYTYKLAVLFKDVDDEDCLVDMANYKANDGLWGTEYIWKAVHKLHPISWWNGFCSNTNLSKVAVRLFHLPSSCEGGEGEFYPSYDNKEEFLANLSPSQREMLTFVSINLKLIDDLSEKDVSKPAADESNSGAATGGGGGGCSGVQSPSFLEASSDKPMALCVPKQENCEPNAFAA